MQIKASVIGAGAWGTTIALLLNENGHKVTLWAFEDETAKDIKESGENKNFLPNIQIPATITVTSDINQAASDANLIVFVIPTQHINKNIKKIKNLNPNVMILSASKGIEIETFKRPSEIIEEEFKKSISVISGPNLAKEISKGKPAATVIASKSTKELKELQNIFQSNRFRVYTQSDIIGVELGGALKNIIAIAAGILDGLELGENARSALIVRGITEISRLGKALGAQEKTFYGLSGIGDLILTGSSKLSRNHKTGTLIGQGKKLDEITKGKEIAEGVSTTKAVYNFAQKNKIELPITFEVYNVLFNKKSAHQAIKDLLNRQPKSED